MDLVGSPNLLQSNMKVLQKCSQVNIDIPGKESKSYLGYIDIKAPSFHQQPPHPVSAEDKESTFESFAKNTTFHGFNQVSQNNTTESFVTKSAFHSICNSFS